MNISHNWQREKEERKERRKRENDDCRDTPVKRQKQVRV